MAIVNNLGESKVTVKKEELLSKMKQNCAAHREDYVIARKGYEAEVIAELERALGKAKAGTEFKTYFDDLDAPKEHVDDYETVIGMLEMSVADEITITERQFRQFVLDKWDWKADFVGTMSKYTSNAR
jgi:hypothetical protein